MAIKKKDSLCFDISSLPNEGKKAFAKSLKTTVDNFNDELNQVEAKPEQEKDE